VLMALRSDSKAGEKISAVFRPQRLRRRCL